MDHNLWRGHKSIEALQSKFYDFADEKFESLTWFDPKDFVIKNKN